MKLIKEINKKVNLNNEFKYELLRIIIQKE